MSKLSKLINNPELFVKDLVKKHLNGVLNIIDVTPKAVPIPNPKTITKPTPKIALKPPLTPPPTTLNMTYVNPYRSIPLIIHSGESLEAGSNQILPWIPIFSKANRDFLILVRNEPFFKWIKANFPWISVALAKSAAEVEQVIKMLPEAKYVFYPSSTGNNIHLIRFNHLNHIFIGHGDSDKQSSAHKALRLYDEVWTAGQAHIDRFKNSNFETRHIKFLKVGRPNLTKILQNSQEQWMSRVSPKILYLPTWEGVIEETNYSSTHLSGQIIREVSLKFNIPISTKYHPFTGNKNKLLKNIGELTRTMIKEENLNAFVISRDTTVCDIIAYNNIFICDISGVVTECLAANCPIFVYIPSDRSILIAKSDMTYKDYCYTYSSIAELLEKIENVLMGDDYLAENRQKAIDYFIGYEETLNEKFIKQLSSISNLQNNLEYTSRLFDEL